MVGTLSSFQDADMVSILVSIQNYLIYLDLFNPGLQFQPDEYYWSKPDI